MTTKWARGNGYMMCVYGVPTTPEEQVEQMSYVPLSRMIDWPKTFDESNAQVWLNWTRLLMNLNREYMEGAR